MGTGSTAESQGIRSDTPAPAPTQTELAQIVANAVAASRQQEQQQAQYVPPQASIYTPPEQTLYTPPAQTLYTPQAEQTATPGITALLPQDQGAQTLMPTASVYTPPAASVYTPPAASVYTPPAPSVFTPAPPSVSTPEDKGRTMGPTQTADAPVTQNPFVPTETAVATPAAPSLAKPTLDDSLTALKMSLGKVAPDLKYDVNGDGVVDTTDYTGLQKAYLGKDPGFAFSQSAGFASPFNKTAEDYAAETKAYQDRIAAEQKETERRQGLVTGARDYANKYQGFYGGTATEGIEDLAAANPNLTAGQLASLSTKNTWAKQVPVFSRTMDAMEKGTAKLEEISIGADEFGNDMRQLVIGNPKDPNSYLNLRETSQPGIYQFSTFNPTAAGMLHGVIQADPKTGKYTPIQDYTKQVQYTPGSKGGFLGGMIGDFGDIFKSLGPIAPIIGNAIAPGLGSALGAIAALDEGNTSGALLSGLSAAGAYGGDAARNALAAEVSGNADLASQYSSGLGGALAQNLPEIKTATNALQLANAVESGNIGGALNAVGNLTGTQIAPEFRTGIAGLGLAQAIASGNVPQAMVLGSQFLPPAASGADVGPPAPPSGGISSLMPAATQAETPADQQVATADTSLPADTSAGLAQLVNAINNPETTASYTGTQVADIGRAGDLGSGTYYDDQGRLVVGAPSDEATDEDFEQLGVGLPTGIETLPLQAEQTTVPSGNGYQQTAVEDGTTKGIEDLIKTLPAPQDSADTTGGIDLLAQQQAELDRQAQQQAELDSQAEQEHEARIAREEQDRILKDQEDQRREEEAYWRLAEQRRLQLEEEERRRAEEAPEEPPVDQVSPLERPEFDPEGPTTPTEPDPVDLEKEEQKRIEQEQEDELRQEQAYWRLVEQRRLEQGEETPDDTTVVDDETTGGIEDLIKTFPADLGDFEGIDMTGGGGETPIDVGDFEGVDMTGGGGETPTNLGEFEGIDMTGGGAGEPAGETDMDDFGDFEGIDMTGGGAGTPVDDFGDFEGIDMTGGGAGEPAKDDDTGFEGVDMTGGGAGKALNIFDRLAGDLGVSPGLLKLIAGGLGLGGLGSLLGQQQQAPAPTPYTGALSNIKMGANYTPYTYKPYADGGAVQSPLLASQGVLPVGYNMAAGGIASLGGYSDGGRLLRGPGDGVSDSIPATISGKQPARLADGEFVIPARIVSEIGNGSTDAGARKLYEMMDKVQAARRKTMGKDKFAVNTKAYKNLPA